MVILSFLCHILEGISARTPVWRAIDTALILAGTRCDCPNLGYNEARKPALACKLGITEYAGGIYAVGKPRFAKNCCTQESKFANSFRHFIELGRFTHAGRVGGGGLLSLLRRSALKAKKSFGDRASPRSTFLNHRNRRPESGCSS